MTFKLRIQLFLVQVILLSGCDNSSVNARGSVADTIPPVINILGKKADTAYLYSGYNDPGVAVLDEVDGELKCADSVHLEITGAVNDTVLGTYFLHYTARDTAGNISATVTRTVHVVEHRLTFLKGVYNVAFSSTVISEGKADPVISAENYLASVSMGPFNNRFEINALRIGPVDVASSAYLTGNAIEVRINYSPADFHQNAVTSGTLSAAKNSFTIDSKVHKWTPSATYTCRNIYTNSKTNNRN